MIARPHSSTQQGFSLAELLVGMAIGLLTVLAIMQVMSTFEGQKRTSSGTSDTQTNGSIALYTIQRMVQSAGFELSTYSQNFRPLSCDPEPTIAISGVTTGIFPVSIIDGGTAPGASEQIIVRGSLLPPSTASQTGQSFAGMPTSVTQLLAGANLGVDNSMGCQAGDLALTMQSTNTYANPTCALHTVSSIVNTGQVALDSTTGVSVGDGLTCLKNWTQLTYSIDPITGAALTENTTLITPGIVQIHAQYGLSDTADSNTVTSWVPATGAWATPSIANRKLIKAVHIAVIARSSLYEKDVVSTACNSTSAPSPTGVCAWEGIQAGPGMAASPAPTVNLTNIPNWDHYRYRVYETVVPLRNNIWNMNTL